MFDRVLVANRGEIAVRIIRTCQRMGIETVAVYSDADADALHVKMAERSVRLGPAPPESSYLNIPRMMEAAAQSGAQAVHPGYGFLSQNLAFARACEEQGLRFIGPSPLVMERMSDKVVARRAARQAGLPIVPGMEEDVSEEEAPRAAREIGYPVMVKATEGGGGIGIRIVRSPEQLHRVMQRSRALAQGAFGSSRLYLERYLPSAAHVEVQIVADEHGHVVALGDRDCSVQRRNQKVIEETPSPKVGEERRREMMEAALALARFIAYTNAGTVEFLLDREGHFYFLEMNTRLQVEHAVTEMVTGLDLVELQLRIAAGEALPPALESVKPRGHSIEARVYPEDPETLLPSVGTVVEVSLPQGDHVRVDGALFPGYQVTTYYDPLLAKVIVWAEERGQAISRLKEALGEFRLEGVKSNIPTLLRALGTRSFVAGSYNTGLLNRLSRTPKPSQVRADDEMEKSLAIAISVALASSAPSNGAANDGPILGGWRRPVWRRPFPRVPARGQRWRDG